MNSISKKIITLLMIVISLPSYCQDDKNKVAEVINNYFDGYTNGDTALLKSTFHEDFYLSWIQPGRYESFKQMNRRELLGIFGPKWKELEIECTLEKIEMSSVTAYALAKVTIKGQVSWIDHITLLREAGKWWIISKVSEGEILK